MNGGGEDLFQPLLCHAKTVFRKFRGDSLSAGADPGSEVGTNSLANVNRISFIYVFCRMINRFGRCFSCCSMFLIPPAHCICMFVMCGVFFFTFLYHLPQL